MLARGNVRSMISTASATRSAKASSLVMRIDWASASNIDGLKIENNIFNTPSGAASGGTIQLAGSGTANNVEIANNLFEGTGTSALVYVGGTANAFDGLDISGNDFVASADNAVGVNRGASQATRSCCTGKA